MGTGMTEWVAKRFWSEATVAELDGGYTIHLDGRPVKSPGRRVFVMPSAAMADAARAEWNAQEEVIDPTSMPVTRSVNSALDQTAPQRDDVIDMLAAYAETDLLCHRAALPQNLHAKQADAWDPLLAWALERYGATLVPTVGIMALDQDPESLAALREAVAGYGNFGLTALYDLIGISGSIVIGLAVAEGACEPAQGWLISRIDEDHQIAQWGADEEAEARAEIRKRAFLHAAQFVGWSGKA